MKFEAGAGADLRIPAQVTAHGAAQAAAEREAQSYAGSGFCGFGRRFAEGLKKAAGDFGGNSSPVIPNAKHEVFGVPNRLDMYDFFGGRRRGIFASVIHKVEENLLDGGDVDVDDCFERGRFRVDHDLHFGLGRALSQTIVNALEQFSEGNAFNTASRT